MVTIAVAALNAAACALPGFVAGSDFYAPNTDDKSIPTFAEAQARYAKTPAGPPWSPAFKCVPMANRKSSQVVESWARENPNAAPWAVGVIGGVLPVSDSAGCEEGCAGHCLVFQPTREGPDAPIVLRLYDPQTPGFLNLDDWDTVTEIYDMRLAA